VFTTPEGSFEPTVMFFGLTNSPAIFQAMMNELLQDLINTRKMAVFIDDVLIGTEMEDGHDELVAEVIRRLEEKAGVALKKVQEDIKRQADKGRKETEDWRRKIEYC